MTCYAVRTDKWTAEMLVRWIKSEKTRIYQQLLIQLRESSAFDELVLSLTALLMLYQLNDRAQPSKASVKASLTNLNNFFHGEFTIESSFSLLSSILWTYLRILAEGYGNAVSNTLIQILDPIATVPNRLPSVNDTIIENYWIKRIHSHATHDEAIAQVMSPNESTDKPENAPVADTIMEAYQTKWAGPQGGHDKGADETDNNQDDWSDLFCSLGKVGFKHSNLSGFIQSWLHKE